MGVEMTGWLGSVRRQQICEEHTHIERGTNVHERHALLQGINNGININIIPPNLVLCRPFVCPFSSLSSNSDFNEYIPWLDGIVKFCICNFVLINLKCETKFFINYFVWHIIIFIRTTMTFSDRFIPTDYAKSDVACFPADPSKNFSWYHNVFGGDGIFLRLPFFFLFSPSTLTLPSRESYGNTQLCVSTRVHRRSRTVSFTQCKETHFISTSSLVDFHNIPSSSAPPSVNRYPISKEMAYGTLMNFISFCLFGVIFQRKVARECVRMCLRDPAIELLFLRMYNVSWLKRVRLICVTPHHFRPSYYFLINLGLYIEYSFYVRFLIHPAAGALVNIMYDYIACT